MKRLITSIVVAGLLISGCSKSDTDGYWKVTLTADVTVGNDVSKSPDLPKTYYPKGYLGAVFYFNADGGDVVKQDCSVTVEEVFFPGCTSEIVSEASDIHIGVLATLAVKGSGDNATPELLEFWLDKPMVHHLDIRMVCEGGTPDVVSDYGSIISSITTPFLIEKWSFSQISEELYTSTREGVSYPPTWSSDITLNMLAERVGSLEE